MESHSFFHQVIQYVIIGLLCGSAVEVYLKVNKVWKRKHDKEVVASISFTGFSISLLGYATYIIYYIGVQGDLLSTICTILYLVEASVFVLISTGLWVKGNKHYGLFKLIKNTLKLEKKDANYLFKLVFTKNHAEKIIKILHQLAYIDNEIDDKERQLIEEFATAWGIDYNLTEQTESFNVSETEKYKLLYKSVQDFLKLSPPKQQVNELRQIMNNLINVDNIVTESESLMIDELNGIVDQYLEDKSGYKYFVIIIPQNNDQVTRITETLPNAQRMEVSVGTVYKIGEYFSYRYAQMISDSHRSNNFFSVVSSPDLNLLELNSES